MPPTGGGRARRVRGTALNGRGWSGRSGAPQGDAPGAADAPGGSRRMPPKVRSPCAIMGAGFGAGGGNLSTKRGSTTLRVGTALFGRSYSRVGLRPREKLIRASPEPAARGCDDAHACESNNVVQRQTHEESEPRGAANRWPDYGSYLFGPSSLFAVHLLSRTL